MIRLEAPWRDLLAPGPPSGLDDETATAFVKPEAERSPRDVELIHETLARDKRFKIGLWSIVLDPVTWNARRLLVARIEQIKRSAPPALPKARGVDEASPNAPPTYLLRRGEYGVRGPEIKPRFPAVLCATDENSDASPVPSARSTGRRTALAGWLVRHDHPLTARVIVNRLWRHHFGKGLVGTPSDFGAMGDEPSHPELLDWLATELVGAWLELEVDPPADSHKCDFSPVVASPRSGNGRRPQQYALVAPESMASRRRGNPRQFAGRVGPAQPGHGGAVGLSRTAPRTETP